eukprot:TRINITY_DN3345_c0_g1_i1.p1 TRINITY_DN3345_c0_g1~~TRINITY_DN3345_c0_g1_i1.p1  ORF type:complete len:110 (+),score=13.42 TRINITY_DN3345_c0_g1_i1:197-526(+)
MEIAYKSPLYISLALLTFLLTVSAERNSNRGASCNGSIAECEVEEEFLMESEVTRRFLQQGSSVSGKALDGGKPVCNGKKGGSYTGSGCLPPPKNPSTRPCTPVYRCRP